MALRVDKLLFFLRIAKTRSIAQDWVEDGHIRINGRRIERAHHGVTAGDVLVFPLGQAVRVIEVLALPVRRGPASEAQSCYRVLDEGAASPLARPQTDTPEGTPSQ
jgi:ribosome-associated heat shock protein Hsp15